MNFRIERLVVEGASQAEARRVAETLQARLTQLASTEFPAAGLSELRLLGSEAAAHSIRLARLDGGSVAQGPSPEQVGRHIAAQIARQICGPVRQVGVQKFVQAGGRHG